jgi:hypothetical protein
MVKNILLCIFLAMPCLWITSCAKKESHKDFVQGSSFHAFIPSNADYYKLATNQKFVLGEPVGVQASPVYPPKLLKYRIPSQYVCLEVTIDAHGMVISSRFLYKDWPCPSESNGTASEFEASARSAVAQWHFVPAKLCAYPKEFDAANASNDCEGADVTPISLKLAFYFEFTNRNGLTHVTITKEH